MNLFFSKSNSYKYFLLLLLIVPTIMKAQINNNNELFEGDIIKTDVIVFNTLDSSDVERLSKIYGHQIFKSDSSRIFDASSIAKIPDSYTLGDGDELTLSIFGASQYDAKFKIGQAGYIQPDGMPRIFLKGLNWGKAKQLIQSRFKRYYVFKPEQFGLTLSQPRVITVNILGEVERPGSYDLVATNTAFNALIAAGGPSETGSYRNIRIIRDQEQIELDIYEIMDKPGAQFKFYLEDNIIIQVPVAQKIVEIEGAVTRPLKYELKEGEGLTELIKYAGGLSADAYQEVIQIERFIDNKQILLDINLKEIIERKERFELINGDLIRIKSLAKAIENTVSIEGAVELPGDYALESTPNIRTLLEKGILKKEARLDVAFLIRKNTDNTAELVQLNLEDIIINSGNSTDLDLKSGDKLRIYQQSRYVDAYTIKVQGAVRESIEFPFDPDSTITIRQAILLGGGLKAEAADFGYLIRTNQSNIKEKSYLKVNVRAAIENPESPDNFALQALDELRVVSKAAFTNVSMVTIHGAVHNPQTLQYDASLKLKDLIYLAEGFKPEASKKLDVFRLEVKNDEPTRTTIATLEVDDNYNIIGVGNDFTLMPNDEVVARTTPNYKAQSLIELKGEVIFPGEYSLLKKNETLANIIQRAGGITSEAFLEGLTILRDSQVIVTKLDQALKNKNSIYNIRLKAGDIITIPEKEDLVSIILANTGVAELSQDTLSDNIIQVAFEAGKSAKWYINEFAAGFGITADKDKVLVAYPNGGTKGTKSWLIFNKYPKPEKGAIISIGAKQELTAEEQEKVAEASFYKAYPKLKKGVIISLDPELLNQSKKEENKEQRAEKTNKAEN